MMTSGPAAGTSGGSADSGAMLPAGASDAGGFDGGDAGVALDAAVCVQDAATIDCLDASLGYEKSLTLDGALLDADLTALPVLIRITDADLAMHAAQDGSDLHFVDDARATTLAHEVERYDATTGSLVAWVRVPTLTMAADTVIHLRYGGGGADRSDPAALWADHHYVWHLAQDPGPGGSGEIRDSTGRAHGTASETMTSANLVDAVAGQGIDFDGSDDDISFTNDFGGATPSTLSAWVDQRADDDGMSDTILSFGAANTDQTRLFYSAHTQTDNLVGGFFNNDLDVDHSIEGSGWHHVVWVWDGSASRFYVDGALVDGPRAHQDADTMGSAGKIGNAIWAARFLRGQLDEVRVSATARDAAWVEAEYESQRMGSTFLKAVGEQQIVTEP